MFTNGKVVLLSCWLTLWLAGLPLSAQAAEPAETASSPDVPLVTPRGGIRFNTAGGGSDTSIYAEGFLPLQQSPGRHLTFSEAKIFSELDDRLMGGTLTLGHRWFSETGKRLMGGYVSYDYRNTGKTGFNQIGLGLESLGDKLDVRLNGYLPVGQSENRVESELTGAAQFQGNQLQLDRLQRFETALAGLDMEVSGPLMPLGADALRAGLGVYYYRGENVDGFMGLRGTLRAKPTRNLDLQLGVQHDSQFDTRVTFGIGLTFPGPGTAIAAASTSDTLAKPPAAKQIAPKSEALVANSSAPESASASAPASGLMARMGDTIQRQAAISVLDRVQRDSVTAINPATNQPWTFQHVVLGNANGSGTAESPFGTVAAALSAVPTDGNGVVYVQAGTNPGIAGFTVPTQVKVLSNGPVQTIETSNLGLVELPNSGQGTLPTVTSTITLAAGGTNQQVSGFQVLTSDNPGITGYNNANPMVDNNTVTLGGTNTYNLPPALGGSFAGTGRGIVLDQSTNAQVLDNTVNNAVSEAIFLRNALGNVLIDGNTVINTRAGTPFSELDSAIFVTNNVGPADVTISNNLIETNFTAVDYGIDAIEFNLCRQDPGYLNCDAPAQATVRIVDNIYRNTGTITGLTLGDGVDVNFGPNATATVYIERNNISRTSDAGITLDSQGNANIDVFVRNNITTGTREQGIDLEVVDASRARISIVGNQVDSAGLDGIRVRVGTGDGALDETAQADLLIQGNNVTNSNVNGGDAGIFVRSREATRVCTSLENNNSTNTVVKPSYQFRQGNTSTLRQQNSGNTVPQAQSP